MQPRYKISRAAIEITKRFEGFRRKAAQLPDGRWTIGYGHTRTARRGIEISEADAEALLIYDMRSIAQALNAWIFTPLTQSQFDALCAFTFNIGLDNFRTSSVLRRVNEGQLLLAACGMELWRKADFEGERIVIDALVRRRSAEKTLFLTPPGGWTPAPSPVLRPALDLDAPSSAPAQTPSVVTAPLEGAVVRLEREEGLTLAPARPEEEGPSPTQSAAAAVVSRLAALFPEPEPEPVAPAAAVQPPVAHKSPPQVANAGPEFASQPVSASQPAPAAVQTPPSAATEQPVPVDYTRRRVAKPVKAPGGLVLWATGGVGLGLVAVGLYWASNARGVVGAGPLSPAALGWLIGLAGIGLCAFSAYVLLNRLGRADGDDPPHN